MPTSLMGSVSEYSGPVRHVSEAIRERETMAYVESILKKFKRNDRGQPLPSHELRTSPDAILTALAQLATQRTKTSRAMVCIFDKDYQYVAAESTPTTSLAPSVSVEDVNGEGLWMCGTAIPRDHGVCDFTVREGARDDRIKFDVECEGGQQLLLPFTKVDDLSQDNNFCAKPYCQPGSSAVFYAAVPIRTKRRINIGVVCVFHDTVVPWWNDEHTKVLRDISQMIMDHWDATRSRISYRRSERMTRGMGSFLEDKPASPMQEEEQFFFETPAPQASSESIPKTEPSLGTPTPEATEVESWTQITTQNRATESDDSAAPHKTYRIQTPADNPSDQPPKRRLDIDNIFDNAAKIIRESLEIEGCLFIDPTPTAFGSLVDSSGLRPATTSAASEHSSGAEGEETRASDGETTLQYCRTLGSSRISRADHSTEDTDASAPLTIAQKLAATLLQRYPRGKIFNFDSNGDLLSSDSSDDSTSASFKGPLSPGVPDTAKRARSHTKSNPWAREKEGKNISDIFPGARSVAFVPIWDSRKHGWFAASFAYTQSSARAFTVQGELTYMKAFGLLAMEHVLRLDTMHDDKAKSDALSCISHELRSPLHGILLGVELLNDTELSVIQGNMLQILETCCRTMLDTIDHLLDFSNINKITKQNKHLQPGRGLRSTNMPKTIDHHGLRNAQPSINLHTLAEEVIDSVFAGFQFQQMSVKQFAQQQKERHNNIAAHNYLDGMRAAEEEFGGPATPSSETPSKCMAYDGVKVFFMIDPRCEWSFHANSGALRRIIMNLFGNALKYTPAGVIKVSLTQKLPKVESRRKTRQVMITVADTGIGMSQSYLQNQLFRPFAQENSLSPGTGLGLSLVHQLTSQLRGRISVDSCVGIGTTVTVSLPLKVGPNPQGITSNPDDATVSKFDEQSKSLRGLRIRLLGFPGDRPMASGRTTSGEHDDLKKTMQSICTNWLQLEVIPDQQVGTIMPDLILMSTESLAEFEKDATMKNTPTMVVCDNAPTAFELSASYQSRLQQNQLVEFVPQPIGPHKLTRCLSLLLDRWRSIQEFSSTDGIEDDTAADGEPQTADNNNLANPTTIPTDNSISPADVHTPPLTPEVCDTVPQVEDRRKPTELPQEISHQLSSPPPSTQELSVRPAMPRLPSSAIARAFNFLLVDDNAINLKILKTYMTKLKCTFQGATNGQEAVDAYKTMITGGSRKCILMDISMPVMDGLEATRRIRAWEASEKLEPAVVIALTGLGSQETQQEAFSSGVDLFLTKPVQLKELGNILMSKGLMP